MIRLGLKEHVWRHPQQLYFLYIKHPINRHNQPRHPPPAASYAVSLASFPDSVSNPKPFLIPHIHHHSLVSPGVGQGLSASKLIPSLFPGLNPCAPCCQENNQTNRHLSSHPPRPRVRRWSRGHHAINWVFPPAGAARYNVPLELPCRASPKCWNIPNNQCHLLTPCPLCRLCHWSVNDTPPVEKAPKVQKVQLLPLKRRAGMPLLDSRSPSLP
ncbi:hypothetical protein BGZ61DRAFT_29475 [Ilyonectria robusta]|uniref:uncharacterized protein n=1 Tax=Ilyonectria robusta TaxID=1079257 RepID=UPI001E8CCF13|nr:uncharacterized protein BGZ61DRAFT_29475 [Ilyonectria robusta]KAH8738217.1 hypothetical protein BGZ61DRAFT_29475 [Ilyonectria robusta]